MSDRADAHTIDHRPCGCRVYTYPCPKGGVEPTSYEPCLPCALLNAGLMLQEAGKRMQEERESDAYRRARDLQMKREITG